MSYILSLKEKKLLQTENFQSLGWVKFRPFKSRIASYHKSQLFFRTGERFKPSNKFYAQVYLFSDTFEKDGRDFQMKVFVKIPCRFIWASDRSKRVSIIVPTNYKFYTIVKVYDPLHLQMVKGLELHPDEAYPVEKIARKGYWGKVYPHLKKNYEEFYNRLTAYEKENADRRTLEKDVVHPDIDKLLEIKNKPKVNQPSIKMTTPIQDVKTVDNSKKILDAELEAHLEKAKTDFIKNNFNGIDPTIVEEKIKEEENVFIDTIKNDKPPVEEESIENENLHVINDEEEYDIASEEHHITGYEENEEIEDEDEVDDEDGYFDNVQEETAPSIKDFLKQLKKDERNKKVENRVRTTPTPEIYNKEKKRKENEIIEEEDIEVVVDEKFVDTFMVEDEDYNSSFQDYDPIDDESIDDILDIDLDEIDDEDEYE